MSVVCSPVTGLLECATYTTFQKHRVVKGLSWTPYRRVPNSSGTSWIRSNGAMRSFVPWSSSPKGPQRNGRRTRTTTLTRCAGGCTGSTRLASTGWVTTPGPGASGGLRRRSGRRSSPWLVQWRRGAWSATVAVPPPRSHTWWTRTGLRAMCRSFSAHS